MTLSWMTQTSRRGNAKKLTCQLALLAGYIAAATARTLLIVAKCQFSTHLALHRLLLCLLCSSTPRQRTPRTPCAAATGRTRCVSIVAKAARPTQNVVALPANLQVHQAEVEYNALPADHAPSERSLFWAHSLLPALAAGFGAAWAGECPALQGAVGLGQGQRFCSCERRLEACDPHEGGSAEEEGEEEFGV